MELRAAVVMTTVDGIGGWVALVLAFGGMVVAIALLLLLVCIMWRDFLRGRL